MSIAYFYFYHLICSNPAYGVVWECWILAVDVSSRRPVWEPPRYKEDLICQIQCINVPVQTSKTWIHRHVGNPRNKAEQSQKLRRSNGVRTMKRILRRRSALTSWSTVKLHLLPEARIPPSFLFFRLPFSLSFSLFLSFHQISGPVNNRSF